MPIGHLLAALTLSLAVAEPHPPGQAPSRIASAEQLIPLVPRVSSAVQVFRSFAFESFLQTDGADGLRTRGWYTGPGQFSLLILDAADDTPLLYASGGKGVVYDALEGRCLPFDYGSVAYFFRVQDGRSVMITSDVSGEKGTDRFDIDLQSLYNPASTTVTAAEPGVYDLTNTGNEMKASIRLMPGQNEGWGRCALFHLKDGPRDLPTVTVDLVDVNRELATKRRALPALAPFAEKLSLTKFPDGDKELNRFWEAFLDGFKRKAPPELQAKLASLSTPEMKRAWLAQVLVQRSHAVRVGLRHPKKRARTEAGAGENPIIARDHKIDWDAIAVSDQRIAPALRAMLKEQVPLREPEPSASDAAAARQLFETMEQKLARAKGYQLDYEAEVTTSLSQGTVKGTLILAPGNRMKFTFGFTAPAYEQKKAQDAGIFISDGKRLAIGNNLAHPSWNVQPVNDRHQETLSGWGVRIGLFFAVLGHVNHGGDEDYRTLPLSDFRMAGQEMIEGRQANVIRFTLKKGAGATFHSLWLDAKTGLPLKLVAQTAAQFGVVETYRHWELDPQLPEETFNLPK